MLLCLTSLDEETKIILSKLRQRLSIPNEKNNYSNMIDSIGIDDFKYNEINPVCSEYIQEINSSESGQEYFNVIIKKINELIPQTAGKKSSRKRRRKYKKQKSYRNKFLKSI